MTTHDEPDEVDDFLGALRRWAADARASDAVASRSRSRWLRHQAEEEATFAGQLLDLAERGEAVVVRTTSGRVHRGRLVVVGRDFCLLRSGGPNEARQTRWAAVTFVATAAIAFVRAQPGMTGDPRPAAAGARTISLEATMAHVLTDVAGDRPRVRIGIRDEPEALVGELRAVGVDVATLSVAEEPPATLYVRLGSVSELSVLGSG